MNAVPAVGVAVAGVTEKCVASIGGGVVVVFPAPQPLSKIELLIRATAKSAFFMTFLQTFLLHSSVRFSVLQQNFRITFSN